MPPARMLEFVKINKGTFPVPCNINQIRLFASTYGTHLSSTTAFQTQTLDQLIILYTAPILATLKPPSNHLNSPSFQRQQLPFFLYRPRGRSTQNCASFTRTTATRSALRSSFAATCVSLCMRLSVWPNQFAQFGAGKKSSECALGNGFEESEWGEL